jgi:hypothetical protein
MVFAELKPKIEQLPPREMLKAVAYLKHLLRADTGENQRDLSRRHAEMVTGRKISLAEVKRRLRGS